MRRSSFRARVFALLLGVFSIAALIWSTTAPGTAAAADQSKAQKVEKAASAPKPVKPKSIRRLGSVVGLNEETMQQYILLHAHVWPEVLERIRKANMRNYSIFAGQLDDGDYYLFSYFEYVGDDFDADMASIAADPVTRDWWKLTDPLQRRVQGTPVGDQWKSMKQVFHTD